MKPVEWVGNSLKRVRSFPPDVRRHIGSALYDVQMGEMPPTAKPLKGIGRGVVEIITRYDKGTWRTVYTVKIGGRVYVLHAFQKKSKRGIRTPNHDIDLIKHRYQQAIEIEKRHSNG